MADDGDRDGFGKMADMISFSANENTLPAPPNRGDSEQQYSKISK